jgi:pimeloyl-ACP methyl ester carboxylesterase
MNTWILVRGWGRGVGHWVDFPEKLRAAFPEDHFEFLELPGNGLLFDEDSPLSITEMVHGVRRQSLLLSSPQKLRLVGISLGGMIMTEWARLYPDEVELICLINSSARNSGKFYERLQPQNFPEFVRISRERSVRNRELRTLNITLNSPDRIQSSLAASTAESEAHPVSFKNLMRQLVAAGRYRFPNRSPVKAFLVASCDDRLVSVRCTENLAKEWKCPLFLHPWAGHDLPLDDPDWMIECLKKMHL